MPFSGGEYVPPEALRISVMRAAHKRRLDLLLPRFSKIRSEGGDKLGRNNFPRRLSHEELSRTKKGRSPQSVSDFLLSADAHEHKLSCQGILLKTARNVQCHYGQAGKVS